MKPKKPRKIVRRTPRTLQEEYPSFVPTEVFHRIALTSRPDIPDKEETLRRIVEVAEKTGATVCIDPRRCDVPALRQCEQFEELRGFDLLIVLGGDGTIIAAVRELRDLSIPLLGIHRGTLGFLTGMGAEEVERVLPSLLQGGGIMEERQLLSVSLEEEGAWRPVGRVLNEVVVGQGGIARLLALHTMIDGEELATFRADGLILATPTGSTAYNLAAGGSIVHPRLTTAATILTPINPHSFSQKPLVVPGTQRITVEVLTEDNEYRSIDPVLTLDGQVAIPLRRGQRVAVTAHDEHATFLRRKEDTFYEKLRGKLGWGE